MWIVFWTALSVAIFYLMFRLIMARFFPNDTDVEVGPNRLSCRSLSTKAARQMGRSGQIFDPLRPDLKENLCSVEPIYSLNLACIFRCMRCSMTQQIRSVASAVCIAALLPIGMSTAHAKPKQCSVAVPSNPQGHWSYRFIDGRKCWYEGNNMLSRSLLQWPAPAPTQSASDEGATSVLTVKPGNLRNRKLGCLTTPIVSKNGGAR